MSRKIAVSALDGTGCQDLLGLLDEMLGVGDVTRVFELDAANGAAVAWLYQHGQVVDREDRDSEIHMKVRMTPVDAERFDARFNA
jgi:GTP-binding protein HflX